MPWDQSGHITGGIFGDQLPQGFRTPPASSSPRIASQRLTMTVAKGSARRESPLKAVLADRLVVIRQRLATGPSAGAANLRSIATRSSTACPGLNVTVNRSPTMTFSPVRGLRACRGFRYLTSKTPKLRSSTRPSAARTLMMASRVFWTIALVSSSGDQVVQQWTGRCSSWSWRGFCDNTREHGSFNDRQPAGKPRSSRKARTP